MHIYREISSAQVKSAAATSPPPTGKIIPAVPTRTSSLHMTDKSRAKVPVDLYERYLKSAYNPTADPWISTISLPASPPPKPEPTKTTRNFGDFYGGTLRDSLRRLSGRSRSPSSTTAPVNKANVIHVNSAEAVGPDDAARSPRPTYSVRARSNSFKENHNGWINVGPELAIKPAANNVQPVINVTIVNGHGHPTSPEPDYNNADKISGNGSVTIQSPGNLRASQFSTNLNGRHPRDNVYRGSFREAPNANRYHHVPEQYSSSSVLPSAANNAAPPEKGMARLGALMARRSTSLSRGGPSPGGPPATPASVPTSRRALSPELKPVLKKRPQSQSGVDRKKNVTFSDYTLVYT